MTPTVSRTQRPEMSRSGTPGLLSIVAMLPFLFLGCFDADKDLRARLDVTVGSISQGLVDVTSDGAQPPDSNTDTLASDQTPHDVTPDTDSLTDSLPGDLIDSLDLASDQLDTASDLLDLLDASPDSVCVPNCVNLVCGPDGCGGSCGLCPSTKPNCVVGKCKACVPSCDAKECGPDGCGGVCGSCPMGFACTEGACIPPVCNQSFVLFVESFDSCSQGAFEIIDFQPDDTVSWSPVSSKTLSGQCSLYLGDPALQLYDTGNRVTLALLSPELPIPPSPPLSLRFHLWAKAEAVPAPQYPYDYDVLYLYARNVATGADTLVFSSKELLNDTLDLFEPVAIDMQPFAGQTIRLVYMFDTMDSIDNGYTGFYLDEVEVSTTCPYCNKDSQCPVPSSPDCTEPRCIAFSNSPDSGTCTNEPIGACCTFLSEVFCDDADPCTTDFCDPQTQVCGHLPVDSVECSL